MSAHQVFISLAHLTPLAIVALMVVVFFKWESES